MSVNKNINKFKRILIANRGEIALRIIRACKELGIESVCVYAHPDRSSMHVAMADYAVKLPGTSLIDTYLNMDKLIQAARLSNSDAIHPGYGFLSENHQFVEKIENTKGLKFIGPSSKSMQALGCKTSAKSLIHSMNIPVLQGSHQPLKDYQDLKKQAAKIGLPLVIKAAKGGGGKGMRIVYKESELKECYDTCKRESINYFASEEIYCERYLQNPRHIEFQTLFDQHGNGIHLFERDCSIQRRYQKLLEEAPSVYLNHDQRKLMGEMAVKIGLSVNYHGAATVEFICENSDQFYFMEINTRIQVEHPATEMITGVDLIKETIKIAQNYPLSYTQDQIKLSGYAIEARINAENPSKDFIPNVSTIDSLYLPNGPFIRVDSHIYAGYTLSDLYDSLIAKIIVWGQDRNEAIARLKRALHELQISGLTTTESFHLALLDHPDFIKGNIYTTFILDNKSYFEKFYQNFKSLNSDKKAHTDTDTDTNKNSDNKNFDYDTISAAATFKNLYPQSSNVFDKNTDSNNDRKKWTEFSKRLHIS